MDVVEMCLIIRERRRDGRRDKNPNWWRHRSGEAVYRRISVWIQTSKSAQSDMPWVRPGLHGYLGGRGRAYRELCRRRLLSM